MIDFYIFLPLLFFIFFFPIFAKIMLLFIDSLAKAFAEFDRKIDYYKKENKDE